VNAQRLLELVRDQWLIENNLRQRGPSEPVGPLISLRVAKITAV